MGTTKPMGTTEKLDAPQADQLKQVRQVVEALAKGAENAIAIAGRTGISPRHVAYALQAGRLLGVVGGTPHKPVLAEAGGRWLATEVGSDAELRLLHERVTRSESLRPLTHDLFSPAPPTREALAERIARLSGLARATAERRAQTLLSWKHQLRDVERLLEPRGHYRVPRQLVLPFGPGAERAGDAR